MSTKNDHSRVSPEGRALGAVMARIADAECAALLLVDEPGERCKSCAFKAGTVPNGCLQTQMDVYKSIAEDVPFACHQHLDDKGQPSTICHGWFAVRRVADRKERLTGKKLPPADYEFSPPDEVTP